MSFGTIVFALVFVIPLIGFLIYIASRDKSSRNIGFLVIAALVVFAVIVAYFVNKDK